jgi:hypothetical protein
MYAAIANALRINVFPQLAMHFLALSFAMQLPET